MYKNKYQIKKLKNDYRTIKDHNSQRGSNRRSWKWFDLMDAIYGGRPTSIGREGALDSATPLLENTIEDSTLCYDSLSTIDSLELSLCIDDSSSQPVLAVSPLRPPTPSTYSCTTTPQRVAIGNGTCTIRNILRC